MGEGDWLASLVHVHVLLGGRRSRLAIGGRRLRGRGLGRLLLLGGGLRPVQHRVDDALERLQAEAVIFCIFLNWRTNSKLAGNLKFKKGARTVHCPTISCKKTAGASVLARLPWRLLASSSQPFFSSTAEMTCEGRKFRNSAPTRDSAPRSPISARGHAPSGQTANEKSSPCPCP